MIRRELVRSVQISIDESLGACKAKTDFQASRVYKFHEGFEEAVISHSAADEIVKKLDRCWNIKTTALYPVKWSSETGYDISEGWSLDKRKAAIQISPRMMTASTIVHEHSHGVIESFKTYFPEAKKIREPGHGALFCGVMAFNLGKIWGIPFNYIVAEMEDYSLRVADIQTVKKFRRIFREG